MAIKLKIPVIKSAQLARRIQSPLASQQSRLDALKSSSDSPKQDIAKALELRKDIDFTGLAQIPDPNTFVNILDGFKSTEREADNQPYQVSIRLPADRDHPFGRYKTAILDTAMFRPKDPPVMPETAGQQLMRTAQHADFEKAEHIKDVTKFVFPVTLKRLNLQRRGGRIQSRSAGVIVGNGKGLVGFGTGKAKSVTDAIKKATIEAVKNIGFVDRHEERTVFGDRVESKYGSCKLVVRARPMGFGLQCGWHIHQICKAAGIKDISAKCSGSRNTTNIIKGALRLLHGGVEHGQGMGSGFGQMGQTVHSALALGRQNGSKPRMERGQPMQTNFEVELNRGIRLALSTR